MGAVSVESLTPAELLERYLQVKDVPEERAKLLLEHGEALISAVDGRDDWRIGVLALYSNVRRLN